jgi:hypothetical protein
MMTAATKNARIRAKQIASHGNCGVKELRFARMGLIRAACRSTDSTATSWEGNNDAPSLENTVTTTDVGDVFTEANRCAAGKDPAVKLP